MVLKEILKGATSRQGANIQAMISAAEKLTMDLDLLSRLTFASARCSPTIILDSMTLIDEELCEDLRSRALEIAKARAEESLLALKRTGISLEASVLSEIKEKLS